MRCSGTLVVRDSATLLSVVFVGVETASAEGASLDLSLLRQLKLAMNFSHLLVLAVLVREYFVL